MPETYWPAAADLMPPDLAVDFRSYVNAYLTPVVFMPSPMPFMVDARSETAVEAKKRELRAKYVALNRFWHSRS